MISINMSNHEKCRPSFSIQSKICGRIRALQEEFVTVYVCFICLNSNIAFNLPF